MGSFEPEAHDSHNMATDDQANMSGIAVSFLIQQHKIEILDNEQMDQASMNDETFNKEFMNML